MFTPLTSSPPNSYVVMQMKFSLWSPRFQLLIFFSYSHFLLTWFYIIPHNFSLFLFMIFLLKQNYHVDENKSFYLSSIDGITIRWYFVYKPLKFPVLLNISISLVVSKDIVIKMSYKVLVIYEVLLYLCYVSVLFRMNIFL